ncbi:MULTISPECIES: hydrogenase expression protein HypA/HybF [Aminobacterium]|uniref:hydrogenase expression protein HypA/HybF n=1 Tax=Aminobacterium TaxID=81466 RepID=UPI0004662B67|nr:MULTISPECIES: hydrogenase expression protein HypA/HybF [Aminobacterium]
MATFQCIECKKEFELEVKDIILRCPFCGSRYLSKIEGELKRGKSWNSKSFSVGGPQS